MQKITRVSSLCLVLAVIALTACAKRDGAAGPGSPPAQCGNNTCEAGETAQSCSQDCMNTTTTCDNDGQCEGGESSATCPADCGGNTGGGDQFYPTTNYSTQVCYLWKHGASGKFYISCDPSRMSLAQMVKFVGGCKHLRLRNYWYSGDYISITQSQAAHQSKPWYTAEIDNTLPAGTVCEMTYGIGPDPANSSLWAQYKETDVVASQAELRLCGTRPSNPGGGYACGIFFVSTGPGQMPTKLGSYPSQPPTWLLAEDEEPSYLVIEPSEPPPWLLPAAEASSGW